MREFLILYSKPLMALTALIAISLVFMSFLTLQTPQKSAASSAAVNAPADNLPIERSAPRRVDTSQPQRSKAREGAMLVKHNIYRRQHGVNPLTWSVDLERTAKRYSQKLSQKCSRELEHSAKEERGNFVGENLAMYATTAPQFSYNGVDATDAWYKEIKDYDYRTQKSTGGMIGHFTQIVWSDSRELGCALSQCKAGEWTEAYWVCHYSPAGNVRGQFKEKVPLPLK